MWVPQNLADDWNNQEKHGGKGASNTYTDSAIEFCLMLRHIYRLPLRQACGLIDSVFQLLGLNLKVPDYSTLSRRAAKMEVCIRLENSPSEMSIAFDSTGLKIRGEGEWKVRTHGKEKRRQWRKLHIAIDVDTQEIVAAVATGSDTHDAEVLGDLLEQIPERIKDGFGDGAYDSMASFSMLAKRSALATIPPRENAVTNPNYPTQRNEHVEEIRQMGLKEWKVKNRYHQRSKVETAMFRMKNCLGERLPSKNTENQGTDLFIRCKILNHFFRLGKPQTIAVEFERTK